MDSILIVLALLCVLLGLGMLYYRARYQATPKKFKKVRYVNVLTSVGYQPSMAELKRVVRNIERDHPEQVQEKWVEVKE